VSLKSLIRGRRLPSASRSRKVVVLIECHLNQNARDRGAARYPALNHELLDLLRGSSAGLVQIACPEMYCLGLSRERPEGMSLREAMETPESRARCRDLAREMADRIEDYTRDAVEVVAVLGGDVDSPGCAVHVDDGPMNLAPRSGIFMQELAAELQSRGLEVPFRGIRESRRETFEADLAWLAERVGT
jgi:predicted secreted protein